MGKVGLLFGDAECVTKFEDLVKPIMIRRHNNPQLPHPAANLDGSQLLNHAKLIDESYVISTRVRTGRTISGFPLPPSISADQRKELEGIVVSALLGLEGNMKRYVEGVYPVSEHAREFVEEGQHIKNSPKN